MGRFGVDFDEDDSAPPLTRKASKFQCASTPHADPDRMPYRLYVDGETLVEPIHDLTRLRRGDQCMVGLNPLRKVSFLIDATFVYLCTWEVWPLFHHFVLYDDVVSVDRDGIPRRQDGEPALIAEYSNTPADAVREALFGQGLLHVWRNLATFRKLPLADYQDSRHAHGLLRIMRKHTDEERDSIILRLNELVCKHESYSLWFRNCEHAAFCATRALSRTDSELKLEPSLSWDGAVGPKAPAWISLQVSHVLFTLARFKLQLIGTYALYRLSLFASDMAFFYPWRDEAYAVKLGVAFYHVFATAPVALQIAIQLGRSVRNLVKKRRRGKLDQAMYSHLMGKEIARAIFVGLCTTGIIVMLPRLMHDLKLRIWSSCVLLVLAYMCSSLLYTLLASMGIRVMLRLVGPNRALGPIQSS
ncbi:hypothetical protein T492DRAFT_1097425 [Pavlovales sp. CCMP2436]|nr:hypothetical protein T492DRAFT_1097425 [Pavlovales sp. CCMP2436]